MQTVQTASLRLSDATATAVLALWAAVESGDLTHGQFRAEAAAAIAAANVAGVVLADLGLSAEVTRQLRTPANPLGLRATDVQTDQSRIGRALDTALADPDVPARLSQVARSEPLLTVATSVQVGMIRHGASGWVRMTDRDPCKLCAGWADGRTRPVGTRMARHVGCACMAQPVFT